jgi:Tfp pilus assembly protein PilN
MADSNLTLPSSFTDRLNRLERALDALDSALAARPAAAPASAQQAVLAELQGRVSRLVAHLEKALNTGASASGSPHAAD